MTTPIFGVDAASMQQRVDWATVDSITAFGFEKTIQGTGYTNPYWADAKTQMLARAAATGFVPGAYMFLEQGNATAQANHFAAVAGDLDGFALFADIELTGSSHPTLADAKECVQRLRELYPRHPVGGHLPHWYWQDPGTTVVDRLVPAPPRERDRPPRPLYRAGAPPFWAPLRRGAPPRSPL